MNVTYAQLVVAHQNRLASERTSVSQQMLRNHSSVLNTFITFIGKTTDSHVGPELLEDFQLRAHEYVNKFCPTNKKTAADKLSILRSWKLTAESLNRKRGQKRLPLTSATATQFQIELQTAIESSSKTMDELAENAGIHVCTLHRWINGRPPRDKLSLSSVRRLERELSLKRGHLETLMPKPQRLPEVVQKNDAYSKRHSVNQRDRYFVPYAELSESFQKEWFDFLNYKTIECPIGLTRSKKGRWATLPLDMVKPEIGKDLWIRPNPNEAAATAQRAFSAFRGYFGFLRWAPSPDGDLARGGLGLPSSDVQTMAMFALPEYVQAFFQFMKARSGGIAHTGHAVLAGLISTLVHPEYGYLHQQPAFLDKVEKYAKGRTWKELCAETMVVCESWQEASAGNKSRDPEAPIRELLRLKDPLTPLVRAIYELDAAAEKMAAGSVGQARLKRDAMLLALAIANPLRERTLTIAKYIPADSDSDLENNLYKDDDARWWLIFSKEHFKNRSSKPEDYAAPLTKKINARLEEYLAKYRPVLVRGYPSCPWLFPSSSEGDNFTNLGSVINRIAQRFIPEVKRMRSHAIRHIVATDYLRKNPGEYAYVAELLHDNYETVLSTYAHCKKEDAFKSYEQHLDNYFV